MTSQASMSDIDQQVKDMLGNANTIEICTIGDAIRVHVRFGETER